MFEEVWKRCRGARRRARRYERRELHELRRWIEHTDNLVHLSVLVFVPFVVGVITWLSGTVDELSFLLFPPLASGTYALFADPHEQYSSARKFIGGLTVGACCGWVALKLFARLVYHTSPAGFQAAAGGAALGLFLTGVVTWVLGVEHPSAFSTALLVLVTGSSQLLYVFNVFAASVIIATVFLAWRTLFYDRRASYLYQSIEGDDHVLVPMDGDRAERTALFAARLAAAHTAGKVVLLEFGANETVGQAEAEPNGGVERNDRSHPTTGTDGAEAPSEPATVTERRVLDRAQARLEGVKDRIESEIDVPCDIVVVAEETATARTILDTARETNCDLVVTPYGEDASGSSYLSGLFRGDIDTVALRSVREQARWQQVLVSVRRAGDIAHSMLDFARRLTDGSGVTVGTCITRNAQRRSAERTLANLVETVRCPCETHVAQADVEEYLVDHASEYDLVMVGASTDRSAASRLLSRPTFERLQDVECDVAVVHKA